MTHEFQDRKEAGKMLASKLSDYKNRKDVIVLALPRGGVPVGFEVAKALDAPLDVFLVRKLGVPAREELAFGAIASGGILVLNDSLVEMFRIPDSVIESVVEKERSELTRRENAYRSGSGSVNVEDKTVIIVDDGLATGATMKAAVKAILGLKPRKIVVAAPVGAPDVCAVLGELAGSSCICISTPEPFYGVGLWYKDFSQTSDAEVCELLEIAGRKDNFSKAA